MVFYFEKMGVNILCLSWENVVVFMLCLLFTTPNAGVWGCCFNCFMWQKSNFHFTLRCYLNGLWILPSQRERSCEATTPQKTNIQLKTSTITTSFLGLIGFFSYSLIGWNPKHLLCFYVNMLQYTCICLYSKLNMCCACIHWATMYDLYNITC